MELQSSGAKGNTGIYEIQFDKRNKEKFFQKEKNEKDNMQKSNNEKENNNEHTKEKNEKNMINVASWVYVMKFLLTEQSYIPNK